MCDYITLFQGDITTTMQFMSDEEREEVKELAIEEIKKQPFYEGKDNG